MVLVAIDTLDREHRAFVEVEAGDSVYIGRSPCGGRPPSESGSKVLPITWPDCVVSRRHSVARVGERGVDIELCEPLPGEGSRNPFVRVGRFGEEILRRVTLLPGETVGIGRNPRTYLAFVEDVKAAALPPPDSEKGLAAGGHMPDQFCLGTEEHLPHAIRVQLKLLQDELPRRLAQWRSAKGLFDRAAGLLELAARNLGASRSAWAFVGVPAGGLSSGEAPVLLTSDHSAVGDFRVSQTLLERLWAMGGYRACFWHRATVDLGQSVAASVDAIVAMRLATPFPEREAADPGGSAFLYEGRELILYGEIHGASEPVVVGMGPLVGLIGRLVVSLLAAHEHLRREVQLKACFSPRIQTLVAQDASRLKPQVLTCTVMFCDRRSSSRVAESAGTADEILFLLGRNQEILARVTEAIFKLDGSVADFTGDCVLGLWGWPMHEGGESHATDAVGAARAIMRDLADLKEWDIAGNRWLPACRIGVSTGPMAVGNVGPPQQMKISVFGNAVNFGSRLEGLGKKFRVPVLLSEETAAAVRRDVDVLVRRLCMVRPAGFDRAYPIYELVLPRDCVGSGATREQVALYEEALADFERRDWNEARVKLKQLSEDDEPAFWLEKEAQHRQDHPPPPGWQGEIHMTEK